MICDNCKCKWVCIEYEAIITGIISEVKECGLHLSSEE